MVKHFNEQLRRQELIQQQKLIQKAQLLRKLRRRDLIKDTKRNCLKKNIQFKMPKVNINEFIFANSQLKISPKFDQTQKELHSYKVALQNTQQVLKQLQAMGIKNQRPADYLVEMYKSDSQMFKVRRYLTEKEEKIKEKMQGKDWLSKNKKKEKGLRKVEAKKARKKNKTEAKKKMTMSMKPKMTKVNGKNRMKKIRQ